MKERLKQLLAANTSLSPDADIPLYEFGLQREKHYDVLVVAPGWKPTKIIHRPDVQVKCTVEHSYISGYEVTGDAFTMAWIQCSSGAGSLIDELAACATLDFEKLVFVGAVGSLTPEIGLGELCTPRWCVSGNLANSYLSEDLRAYVPFQKVYPNDAAFVDRVLAMSRDMGLAIHQEPVFCTDSIFGEYAHMDFIRSFGASLIEMETSSFYLMADLMEKPAIALLDVSDNSTTGDPLLARTPEQKRLYHHTRTETIPELLIQIAKLPV